MHTPSQKSVCLERSTILSQAASDITYISYSFTLQDTGRHLTKRKNSYWMWWNISPVDLVWKLPSSSMTPSTSSPWLDQQKEVMLQVCVSVGVCAVLVLLSDTLERENYCWCFSGARSVQSGQFKATVVFLVSLQLPFMRGNRMSEGGFHLLMKTDKDVILSLSQFVSHICF